MPPRASGPACAFDGARSLPGGAVWEAMREQELREVERQRALCHLLMDLGAVCSRANVPERLFADVLVRVAMGLGARNGWIVRQVASETEVHGTGGPCGGREAEAVRTALEAAVATGRLVDPAEVPAAALAHLPGVGRGAAEAAVIAPLPAEGRPAGWIVLVGERETPLVEDALSILGAVTALLGAALERLAAVEALRRHTEGLAGEVARGADALRSERASLEARVRERTFHMERAKQAVLENERRLFERERVEGVHQLAAGVAHALNNPLAALQASLEFVREVLGELAPGAPLEGADLKDLSSAVDDALAEARRMVALVQTRFGEAQRSRRAAVRTDLARAVEEALTRHRQRSGGRGPEDVRLQPDVIVGIGSGELVRWLLAILEAASAGGAQASLHVGLREGVPLVELRSVRAACEQGADRLRPLVGEIQGAGGDLFLERGAGPHASLLLTLPTGVGERRPAPDRSRVR